MHNKFGYFSWLVQFVQFIWSKLINNKILCRHSKDYSKKDYDLFQLKQKTVPEVKGKLIFGTLFDLIAAGGASRLHEYIDKRHQQLGCIFRERLGGTQDAVFVSSAQLMRSVFLYEGQCPRHPLPDAWLLYNKAHNQKRGLFFMDGEEWLQTRRILNRLLLNGNMQWMKLEIAASTDKLINEWKLKLNTSKSFEIVDLEGKLYRWSIDVICSIMFGSSYTNLQLVQKSLDEFAKIVYKIFESSSALMNFPPKLAKAFKLRVWQEFEQNVHEVLSKGASIIDTFLALLDREVDECPPEVETYTLHSKLKQAGMSEVMLKRIFVDLVIAAADTTAYSTEWALYLIAKDASMQRRILKDAGASYVHGLIKETLRLYPVAPFIGRYLASDAKIGEFYVKKNTLVLLSLYTAGRDEQHFPEALHVKPERWQRNEQTDQLDGVLQAHGSLPFAIGHRSCIGKKVALSQMETLLTAVVSNFKLKCLNSSNIQPILRMITVPDQPVRISIQRRQCNNLEST